MVCFTRSSRDFLDGREKEGGFSKRTVNECGKKKISLTALYMGDEKSVLARTPHVGGKREGVAKLAICCRENAVSVGHWQNDRSCGNVVVYKPFQSPRPPYVVCAKEYKC